MAIVEAFVKFPEEAAVVGRLLGGYTWLEVSLMQCVQVIRGDIDTVLKAMYRTRGETQRIDVGDAFGHQHYKNIDLGTQFEMAVGALRFCLRIRNQYSHCIWLENKGKLAFADLEEIAIEHAPINHLANPTQHQVDIILLQEQEGYFENTAAWLVWVNSEGQRRKYVTPGIPAPVPKQLAQPLLHMP